MFTFESVKRCKVVRDSEVFYSIGNKKRNENYFFIPFL